MADKKETKQKHSMVAACEEVSYIKKDGWNAHFKYAYLTEMATKEKGWAALRKHGFVLKDCRVEIMHINESLTNVICSVTLFVGLENDELCYRWQGIGQGKDSADKATMKAQTAAYREAMKNGLGIAAGLDPEKDTTVDRNGDTDLAAKLVEALNEAKSVEDLEPIKAEARTLDKGTEAYKSVLKAFTDKKKELTTKA